MSDLIGAVLLIFGIIVGVAILMAFPTLWIWNGVIISAVDWANPIGFWDAFWINFLSGILFKSTSTSSSSK